MSLPRKHNKGLRSSPNRRSRSGTPHRTKPYSLKSRCKTTRPALLSTPSLHQHALHPRSSLPATLTPPTRVFRPRPSHSTTQSSALYPKPCLPPCLSPRSPHPRSSRWKRNQLGGKRREHHDW
ncbi:hypothetical protein PENSPDRAFT_311214 [Peniophora sp. CONT]|nr:hypothetical protein PENSPDRAFT_311214 [Peniophora sp. CONT]